MREIISDDELYACPIEETIMVCDLRTAVQMLNLDAYSLRNTFLTPLHQELLQHMLQRATMSKKILLSPNLCCELFSFAEFMENQKYIVNKLVGRWGRDDGYFKIDYDTLFRQTFRLMKKYQADEKCAWYFFWHGNPNVLLFKNDEWYFHSKSPAYKSLLDHYARFQLVKRD